MGFFGLVSHRMLWSFVFMFSVAWAMRSKEVRGLFRERRAVILLSAAGFLVAGTWWLFIYAINTGHVLQTSLGYYINPLMTILAGMVIFREKLTLVQKLAAVLAAVGVAFFTIDYGSFPWISLGMATLFALYGALKKKGRYPAVPAMAVETAAVAPLALVFVVVSFFLPDNGFFTDVTSLAGWATTLLLIGAGVITVVPLIWYAVGVNSMPLSWLGFLQYISPTTTLLLGVFLFGEPFTLAHGVCFGLIWVGLMMISIEMAITSKRNGSSGEEH